MCTEYTAERADFLSRLNLPELDSPANIKILWCEALTNENVTNLVYAGEHLHTFYEILISLRGSFVYECGGAAEEIKEGEALFIPKQVLHRYISCSDDMIRLSIGFASLAHEKKPFFAQLSHGKTAAMPSVLENTAFIFRQADKKDIYSPKMISARAFEIIYSVCESLGASFCELAVDYNDTRYLIAKAFIEENKNKMISCDDVARECGLSVKQLGRIFKKSSGSSVFEHITSVKTEYAKTLLLGKEASVKEITYLLGFENEGSFTSFFKRHCGMTPMAFKKQHRRYLDNMS